MVDKRELKKIGLSDEFIERAVTDVQINPVAFHNLFEASGKADDILDFYIQRETDSDKRKKLKSMVKQSDLTWIKVGGAEIRFLTEVGPDIWRGITKGEKVKIQNKETVQEIKKELEEAYESMKKLLINIHRYIKDKVNEEECVHE